MQIVFKLRKPEISKYWKNVLNLYVKRNLSCLNNQYKDEQQ